MKKLLCVLMFGMMFVQAELTTRVYEINNISFDNDGNSQNYSIEDLTGYNLSYGFVSILHVSEIEYS